MPKNSTPAPTSKFNLANQPYVSFDGGFSAQSQAYKPDRASYWDEQNHSAPGTAYRIARGGGYSYAAASFSKNAITTEHCFFNRFLAYDDVGGLLTVQSGITLGEIHSFLGPRKRFLAVQPGYPRITVGGCAASDVHGKNQYLDGTFVDQVESLKLFHPDHGILDLARNQNTELFFTTCGGYGLTGEILSMTLRTKPILATQIKMKRSFLPNARDLAAAFKQASETADMVYSWHDFNRLDEGFGEGFIMAGRFEPQETFHLPEPRATRKPLRAETRGNWTFPFFNSWTTSPFNRAFLMANRLGNQEKTVPLYDFLFPVHDKEAYFKLFGRAGFHEYQTIIPFAHYHEYLDTIKDQLKKAPLPITLASAKLFSGTQELLRFTGKGICMALNFPRCRQSREFIDFLDRLCIRIGALPNIIKDSRLPLSVVKTTYSTGYEAFRERLHAFDPSRKYRSELSERLGL